MQQDLFSNIQPQTSHSKPLNVEVDVLHQKENCVESQANLDANRQHFSKQCKEIYKVLMDGTIIDWRYGKDFETPIVDAQRRSRDLLAAGIQITKEWVKPSNRKILNYYMTPEQIEYNRVNFGESL